MSEQRVRLRAVTTFVREWDAELFEGETVEETLAMEQAIYDEEPLDTAFERYVERSLSQNEQTVVQLAEAEPAPLRTEYSVRYPDHSTVYMSDEKAYCYSANYPTHRQAELLREILIKRGPNREDAVVVKRQVTDWEVVK